MIVQTKICSSSPIQVCAGKLAGCLHSSQVRAASAGGNTSIPMSLPLRCHSQRGKCQGQIPPLPYQPSIGRSAYRLGRSLQDALRSASQVALRPHRCDAFVQGTCSLF